MAKTAVYNSHAYGVDNSIDKAFRLMKSNSMTGWEGEYIVATAADGEDVDTWTFSYQGARAYRGGGESRVEVELNYDRCTYTA